METKYGICTQCVKACPVQAKRGRNFFEHESRELRLDVAKCEQYFKKLGRLNKLEICGMCVVCMPIWKKSKRIGHMSFLKYEKLDILKAKFKSQTWR